jgi:hypothetical protein
LLILACRVHASGGLGLNGGSVVITGPAGLDTTGDINLSTGTLQSIGNAQFHVGGNWSQSGSASFQADQSTVFFSGNSTLSGTSSFCNLTAATPGQTLTLQAGFTQTIAQTFTLNGSSGTPTTICSSSPGTFANLVNLGSNSVNDVTVKDINAFGGVVINAGPASTLTHTINWSYGGALLAPPPVTQVAGQSNTLTWVPVTAYADGSSIPPGIGTTYQVTRYSDLGNLANGTLLAEGLLVNSYGPVAAPGGTPAYYGIRAVINDVQSDPFYIDNSPAPNYAFAASNGSGYVLVPPSLQEPFAGISLPYVWLSLTTQVAPMEAGILASGSLQVNTRGPGLALTDYHFSPPGATMALEATGPPPAGETVFPVQMNVDGVWRTVGTATFSQMNNAFVFTVSQTGVYRVGADPLGGMSAVLQSVHPRIFSPNGDGYNDIVHFDLNNPDQEPVSGQIFDLRATKVADLQPSALGLQWDGRGPGGRTVPGGVYIYQIHVGHQRVNGTVVVVK